MEILIAVEEMEVESAYQEALDYLYRFVDYSLVRNFHSSPEKFGLERMFAFLDLLGNPQRQFQVIHVAGTKGKGSTAALIASSLRSANYRVGLYTSPHLQEYTERIQVNGQDLSRADLVELVNSLRPIIARLDGLTWFEITTAIAFLYFTRQRVEVAVIEVGLGGRLDATNVVDPLVSVITSLSLDHMAVLGDSLPKIAIEKAGIIKPGRPVVSAPQKAEALQVIEQVAGERGCSLAVVGRDYQFEAGEHSLDGQTFLVHRAGGNSAHSTDAVELRIPLLGLHQVENAVTAYAALQAADAQGLKVSEADIRRGFSGVSWPGRFEVLRRDPPIIIDSAHNRDSAMRLRQALDDYLPDAQITLLFGASDDKDVDGMLAELLPRAQRMVATQSIHPRAAKTERLAGIAQRSGCQAVEVLPVEDALETALQLAGNSGAIVVTGSLFIAAAVRDIWLNRVYANHH